jgi:hypothetical protein
MNVHSPTGVYDYGLSNLIPGAMHHPKPRQHPKAMSKQKALKYKSINHLSMRFHQLTFLGFSEALQILYD